MFLELLVVLISSKVQFGLIIDQSLELYKGPTPSGSDDVLAAGAGSVLSGGGGGGSAASALLVEPVATDDVAFHPATGSSSVKSAKDGALPVCGVAVVESTDGFFAAAPPKGPGSAAGLVAHGFDENGVPEVRGVAATVEPCCRNSGTGLRATPVGGRLPSPEACE